MSAYRLSRRHIATAAQYCKEHMFHSRDGTPMVADRYETPSEIRRTLTRLYGTPRIPGDGETAYWMIEMIETSEGTLLMWTV